MHEVQAASVLQKASTCSHAAATQLAHAVETGVGCAEPADPPVPAEPSLPLAPPIPPA
jgi:hypothetical protein